MKERTYLKQTWDENIFQKSCRESMHREYLFSWTELLIAAVVFVVAVIVDRYWLISISNENKDLKQIEQQISVKT